MLFYADYRSVILKLLKCYDSHIVNCFSKLSEDLFSLLVLNCFGRIRFLILVVLKTLEQ